MSTLGRIIAAIALALGLPAAALAEEPPIRVVIFERLMEDPPVGLPVLSNAARQLEQEFRPASIEIDGLSQRLAAAEKVAFDAEQAGQRDDAAIERVNRLRADVSRKSEDAAIAYQRRQTAVFDPLVKNIDLALQRYGAQTEGGDVFLIGSQEFNAPEPGIVFKDVSPEFVAWMAGQP